MIDKGHLSAMLSGDFFLHKRNDAKIISIQKNRKFWFLCVEAYVGSK